MAKLSREKTTSYLVIDTQLMMLARTSVTSTSQGHLSGSAVLSVGGKDGRSHHRRAGGYASRRKVV